MRRSVPFVDDVARSAPVRLSVRVRRGDVWQMKMCTMG
jgi:hypothetical protein